MANPDRANGFEPVYHLNGGSWNNALAQPCIPTSATETEHSDYFIGMPVTLANVAVEGNTEELNHYAPVKPMIDEDDEAATIAEMAYGVVVGFANVENNGTIDNQFGMYDPTNLEKVYLDLTEIEATGNDWLVYVALVERTRSDSGRVCRGERQRSRRIFLQNTSRSSHQRRVPVPDEDARGVRPRGGRMERQQDR